MSNTAIKVENLSKKYQIGQFGTGTLSWDIERWLNKMRGKEDPFHKIEENNFNNSSRPNSFVWSLKDINFEINKGDRVGIIGNNGAGKSTLLKIMSKVTAPTSGKIMGKGRVAGLLEVGTGFHPELTGRENIFLNGAILGMKKNEINKKLDEIIAFSGVEQYIDTPVKRYSSGMYVRLAFAVAAHLESDILIVDEVLAVGDIEFQKKCLTKMDSVTKEEGKTLFFVSHNMGAVQYLCNDLIILNKGSLTYNGSVAEGIEYYLKGQTSSIQSSYHNTIPQRTDFISINIVDSNNENKDRFSFDDSVAILFDFVVEDRFLNAVLGFRVQDQLGRNVFTDEICINDHFKVSGIHKCRVVIPSKVLVPNKYHIIADIHLPNIQYLSHKENVVSFLIEETGSPLFHYSGVDYGCVFVKCDWLFE